LRVITLDGGVFLDAQFTAPWAVLSQVEPPDLRHALPTSAHVMAYHYVAAGRPLLQIEGGPPVPLQAGEIVLLPRNDRHTLSSAPGLAGMDAGALVTPPQGGGLAQIRFGGGGEATQIVCGYIGCESGRHPLIDALPSVLKLNVREWSAGAWIETLFRYAAQETAAGLAGSETSLAKVSELRFVEVVRRHLGAVPGERRGWLAGLVDPTAGRALALMHERPAHAWTVDLLAEQVHLSRSAFAERFTSVVGVAPLGYLAHWRMQLAKRALRQGGTVARVAAQVGYDSEAAFSRAFKREVGCAPTIWRQRG
jgi:AraC-like DNA-binding protein